MGTALTQSIHAGIPCLVFLGYAQNRKIISTFYLLRLLRLFFVFSVAYYLIPLLLNHVLMETMPIPANDDLFVSDLSGGGEIPIAVTRTIIFDVLSLRRRYTMTQQQQHNKSDSIQKKKNNNSCPLPPISSSSSSLWDGRRRRNDDSYAHHHGNIHKCTRISLFSPLSLISAHFNTP